MSCKIRFGVYELDNDAMELRKHGVPIRLQEQPFRVLAMLAERPGQIITRGQLQERIWGDTFVDFEHSLNKAINRVREALNDNAGTPQYIETVPRRGYRFIAPIAPISALVETEAPEPTEEDEPGPEPRNRRFRFFIPGLVFAGICGVMAILWLWKPSPSSLKITDTFQLTSDGHFKNGTIVTDGSRLYFTETIAGHEVVAEVPISGGDPVLIHSPFQDTSVTALSIDKSQLLVGEGHFIQDHPLWLLPVIGGSPRRLANVVAHDASWSPDGKHLVYARAGDLYLAKADGTEPHRLLPGNPDPKVWAWWPRWSLDSHRVRFTLYQMEKHESALWEVTVEGRSLHEILLSSDTSAMQCCGDWTADGKYYLFNSWNSLVTARPHPAANLWGARQASGLFRESQAEPFQITAGPMRFFNYTLDPSRNVIYTISTRDHGELLRYDVTAKRVVPFLSAMSAQALSFSPNGAWVAYVKYPQGELWRSRTNGSEALRLSSSPLITAFPSWSADSSQIAFSGQTAGQNWQLYVVPANGGPPQLLPGSTEGHSPTWSPDGTALAFDMYGSDTQSRIRIIDLNHPQISDVPGSQGFFLPQWSRNGRYMAAVSDTKLVLFDFKTGKWSDWVTGGDPDLPHWSRDGKSIYFADSGDDLSVLHVALGEHTPRKVVDLNEIQFVKANDAWFSLTPDDEPLLLRETGGGFEIYAEQWTFQ
jgi:DNA-binding winged helix-turn-helix (wHTH) protein/Tol biopolymer transport system component